MMTLLGRLLLGIPLILFCFTQWVQAQENLGKPPSRLGLHLFAHHVEYETEPDLWGIIRTNLHLPTHDDHPDVQAEITRLQERPKLMEQLSIQAKPYLYYVFKEVQARDMPAEIALLPMIESAYNPYAFSTAGAAGLWQIMPGTGSGYHLDENHWFNGRRDVITSTKAALDYLTYLHNYFEGDWLLALAAYDAGEGTVRNAIKNNLANNLPTDFWSLSLPRETRRYVPKLLAVAHMVEYAPHYEIALASIPNVPYFTTVDLKKQVDLKKVAQYAEVPLKELYQLNPGFNRASTNPEGSHPIVLPIEHVAQLDAHLNDLDVSTLARWRAHTVAAGETITAIARKYHLTPNLVRTANQLPDNDIQVGQALIIPDKKNKPAIEDDLPPEHYRAVHHANVGPQKAVHVVTADDNYWRICHTYHVKLRAIEYWNHMSTKAPLKPGQTLTLWVDKNKPAVDNLVTSYVVAPGDTFASIASAYFVTENDIRSINPKLKNTRSLKKGTSINVPVWPQW